MMDADMAAGTLTLYDVAIDQMPDVRRACLTLIGAAMACQVALRDYLPAAKVDDLVSILSVAGAVLIDDDCAGLLDLAKPAGRA